MPSTIMALDPRAGACIREANRPAPRLRMVCKAAWKPMDNAAHIGTPGVLALSLGAVGAVALSSTPMPALAFSEETGIVQAVAPAGEVKRVVSSALSKLLNAAETLNMHTSTLVSLNQEMEVADSPDSSQQAAKAASLMSADALLLAKEANQLAAYEAVPDMEKRLALQIYEAAKLLAVIAAELAEQEAAHAVELPVAEAPSLYASS